MSISKGYMKRSLGGSHWILSKATGCTVHTPRVQGPRPARLTSLSWLKIDEKSTELSAVRLRKMIPVAWRPKSTPESRIWKPCVIAYRESIPISIMSTPSPLRIGQGTSGYRRESSAIGLTADKYRIWGPRIRLSIEITPRNGAHEGTFRSQRCKILSAFIAFTPNAICHINPHRSPIKSQSIWPLEWTISSSHDSAISVILEDYFPPYFIPSSPEKWPGMSPQIMDRSV